MILTPPQVRASLGTQNRDGTQNRAGRRQPAASRAALAVAVHSSTGITIHESNSSETVKPI